MEKKICITGERDTCKFYNKILEDICIMVLVDECEFLFGDCSGVDQCAKRVCDLLGIKYTVFPADWHTYGKAAGPIRNAQMINELVVLNNSEVWAYHTDLSKSKGTKNTIKLAKKKKLKIIIYEKTDLTNL